MSKVQVWVTKAHSQPRARVRLFCLPHSGGSAQVFENWCQTFPPEIHVCPIQLPGRHTRFTERPFTKIAPLVSELAPVIACFTDLPFAIFGHCAGALIGFELVRQLRRNGVSLPVHFFASAYAAPHNRPAQVPIHTLSTQIFVERLRQMNGTPQDVLEDAELMELLLPMLRADFAICETYVYTSEPPLDCPITVFGARDDTEVSREQLESWRDLTQAMFTIQLYPGGQFSLPGNRMLLRDVIRTLAQFLGVYSSVKRAQ